MILSKASLYKKGDIQWNLILITVVLLRRIRYGPHCIAQNAGMSGTQGVKSQSSARDARLTNGRQTVGRPRLELVGMRSGRLTVISPADGPSGAGYYVMWECLCDCGNRVIKRSGSLKKGTSTSCGCLTKEKMSANAKTHGRSGTKTYWVWHNMKHRCSDTNHPSWSNYGERGIKVCDRWVNSVENFISDMGLRPAGMELDRIDPHGNYCVENCRWVSRKTNMNNKRNNHYLEFNGERLTLSQWGERTGINWNTIRRRVLAGWGVADSLTKPLMYQDRKKPVRAQGK